MILLFSSFNLSFNSDMGDVGDLQQTAIRISIFKSIFSRIILGFIGS